MEVAPRESHPWPWLWVGGTPGPWRSFSSARAGAEGAGAPANSRGCCERSRSASCGMQELLEAGQARTEPSPGLRVLPIPGIASWGRAEAEI